MRAKAFFGLLLILAALGGVARAELRPVIDQSAAPVDEIVWVGMRMALPTGWIIEEREDGSGLIVRSSTTSEDVRITLYGRRDESAEQVLERYVADTAPPDPKAPEVRDILPYTPFAMPNGQPAVMRIEDLGDDEVVVSYAVALPGEMYAIHFYRTGRSDEAVERYSNLVRNATFVPLIVGN